jgi:transposase
LKKRILTVKCNNKMGIRKGYSKEFKQEAIRLAAQSTNKSRVARDLGIHLSMLRGWEQQLAEEGEKAFPGKGNPKDEEVSHLKKENARLKQENEILKKAVGIFSKRSQ